MYRRGYTAERQFPLSKSLEGFFLRGHQRIGTYEADKHNIKFKILKMAEIVISQKPGLAKKEQYEILATQIKGLIEGENDILANVSNLVAALKSGMNFFWAGCYLVKNGELVLGPFQGPVACTRIKKGKGVCGTSWLQKQTIIVPNVEEFPGHIACSAMSKSEIVIPLIIEDEVFLVLDVDSDKLADFDETDKFYLEQILDILRESVQANYVKVSADQFELKSSGRENESAENLKLLSEIGRAITSSLSIEQIIKTVYKHVNQLMDANAFGVGIYKKEKNRIEFPGIIENGKMLPFHYDSLSEETRLSVFCFKHNKEILIGDLLNNYHDYIPDAAIYSPKEGEVTNSVIYLPLTTKEKKQIGVITVQSFQKNAYTEYHLNILKNLAVYASIALENAILYMQMEKTVTIRTRELLRQKNEIEKSYLNFKLLSEIGQQITSSLSIEKVIETAYENINKLMDASSFWIGIYNASAQRLDYPLGKEKGKTIGYAYYDLSDDKYLPVWSFKNQKVLFINDYRKEYNDYIPNSPPPIPVAGDVPESSIWYPLISKEGVPLGILTIQSFEINAYSEYHLNIVKNLAVFTTIALENAIMYEQVEQKVKERTVEIEEKNKVLEKLSIVASETHNGVIIADADGILEWMNDAFIRIHEFDISDFKLLIGEPIFQLSRNPDRLKKLFNQSIKEKKSIIYESINVCKDGSEFWTQSTLTPIFKQNGIIKKIIVIDTDITERKKQEEEIQEKNKSITDSINYAKRIQEAILPSTELIYNALPESFILYQPKDVVSGDFYAFAERGNKIIIAAVDCTGHGVPGAFMSMIGSDLLNQIIIEKNITKPSEILNNLHVGVKSALKQDQEGAETRDGMDIAICCITKPNASRAAYLLEYAGANRPIYIIKKNKTLQKIKPDKYAIAGIQIKEFEDRLFNNHTIELSEGDAFYIFTDGFADQFGGEKGKKFMTKNFQNLLLSIQSESMKNQKAALLKAFNEWKGKIVQIDDVLIIGVRV